MNRAILPTLTIFIILVWADLARAFSPQFEIDIGASTGGIDQFSTGTLPTFTVAFTPRWDGWGFDIGATRFAEADTRQKGSWFYKEEKADLTAFYIGLGVDPTFGPRWGMSVSASAFMMGSDAFDNNAFGLRTEVDGVFIAGDNIALTFGPTAWLGAADSQELALFGFDVGVRFRF